MATIKQRLAVERIVENSGNVSKSMREVGYSPNTAKVPQRLTESKGFREIADELGLTDNFIAQALVDDIKAKPGDRSRELALAGKFKGLEKIDVTSMGKALQAPILGGASVSANNSHPEDPQPPQTD